MDDQQQRREDAWAVMKQMHEDLAKPKEPALYAAGGWCAPSSVTYDNITISQNLATGSWIGEAGPEFVIPITRGGVTYR